MTDLSHTERQILTTLAHDNAHWDAAGLVAVGNVDADVEEAQGVLDDLTERGLVELVEDRWERGDQYRTWIVQAGQATQALEPLLFPV